MPRTLFINASIFDGSGADPFPGEIMVDESTIVAVQTGAEQLDRNGAEIFDCHGAFLMPGMVESHGHLTYPYSVDRSPKIPGFKQAAEEVGFLTAHNAKVTLDAGFTSVFSGGATNPRAEIVVRDEINAGWIPGPRLLAGSIERTDAGHAENVPGGLLHFDEEGNRPEPMRAFVRDMKALGADVLKLILSGRGGAHPELYGEVNYSDEALEAFADEARQAGLLTAAHAFPAKAVTQAARNRFRIIYHCYFADEEALDAVEAAKDETFIAPSLGSRLVLIHEKDRGDHAVRTRARAVHEMLVDSATEVYAKMRARGIRLLPGGDYGFPHNMHGENARDLQYFVEHFGFTPAEALVSATKNGGELLGMADRLGLIRDGYIADLLVIDGDPISDIRHLQDRNRIVAIMQGGRFYKQPASKRFTTEADLAHTSSV